MDDVAVPLYGRAALPEGCNQPLFQGLESFSAHQRY